MVKTTRILFVVAAAIIAVPIDASSAVSRSLERRHVSLAEPRPYKGTGYGPTNPLDTDGGNYPCKAPGGDGSKLIIDGAPTTVIIGEPQTVSFDGHAVHGGGSCQFGLTEGFAPTKNSVFKVIQSIEGGCPKANQPGNLEAGQKADTFSFTVPADFAPGDYTFGWIWINRIGGAPEIYMNCAPITVKAGKGSKSTRRSKDRRGIAAMSKRQAPKYPDFFLANLGSLTGGCDTNDALRQQVPISYPNPGSNVLRPEGTLKLLAQKCDGNPHNKGAAPAKPSGTATPTTQPSATTTAIPTSTSVRVTSSSATTTVLLTSAPASPATTTATRATSSSATTTAAPTSTSTRAPSSSATTTTIPTSATSTRGPSSPTPAKPTTAGTSTSTPTKPASSTATPKPKTSPVCGCHSAKPTPASPTTATPASPTSRPPTPANPQTPPGSCTDGHLMCVETVMFSTCTGGRWVKPQPLADNTICALEGEAVGLKLTVLW